MLVFISDLHLTDGSSGSLISPGAFHLFAERLQDMAVRASCRADGSYRPIDRIDLVLLGDVLDVTRSRRWLQGNARPWSDPCSPELLETVRAITSEILHRNEAALGVFRALATEGAICVSPANYLARPVHSAEGQPVSVQIHYMVGNHDWYYHLPGAGYDLVRQQLVGHLGLCNRFDAPFAHEPRESDALLEAMRRHKVFARHGDIFDPLSFAGDRDAGSLGDVIVIELLQRFAQAVEGQLGEDLPGPALLGLREIDDVRPLLMVPAWVDGLLERTCAAPGLRLKVKKIWDSLVDDFLELPIVRSCELCSAAESFDGLESALKFSRKHTRGRESRLAKWLAPLRNAASASYSRHALSEQDFRNRRARHIVYGHTHEAETAPLEASFADGYVLNQTYFNAGTWRRVHRQTCLTPGGREFIPSDTLTYLAVFQGDERSGRPYETWTGTLAAEPSEAIIHRLDRGVSSAAGGSFAPADAQVHAPHFTSTSTRTPIVPTRRA